VADPSLLLAFQAGHAGSIPVARSTTHVYSSLPDASTFQQILIGGAFS